MQLNKLVELYAKKTLVRQLSDLLFHSEEKEIVLEGVQTSFVSVLFSSLQNIAHKGGDTFLFCMNDEDEAGYLYQDLLTCLGEERVLIYPSSYKSAIKYARIDEANQILRAKVWSRLMAPSSQDLYIVTYPEALVEKVPSPILMRKESRLIRSGECVKMQTLEESLQEHKFRQVDYVYSPGEYAIRGSIVDIYPYSSEYPVRLDFFGDEIDEMRLFDVETQLSKEKIAQISLLPQAVNGEEDVPFLESFPQIPLFIVKDIDYVEERVEKIYSEGFIGRGKNQDIFRGEELMGKEELIVLLEKCRKISLSGKSTSRSQNALSCHISPQPFFHKNFDLLGKVLARYKEDSYDLYILSDSEKQQQRLSEILKNQTTIQSTVPVYSTLHEGWIDEDAKVVCFTDHQIFDRYHKYSLRNEHIKKSRMAISLKELRQLCVGDYIVHVDHGVGRFAGLVRMSASNGMQEMIKLVYQNDDVVFVSIHALYKISKYKGKEGQEPRLSALGTGAWEKLKDRTKRRIKDIARDLINLYSKRLAEPGFAYSPDSFLQQELEASFPYEDTPDQIKVTQEVKLDMERPRPMDRLVCGDVGFGKTEIAIRAAFKAVSDNKQVAVMVPTTVLALQHYNTFSERLKNFPVRVEYLSRARSSEQTRKILKDLLSGEVNIIIGTHKLIGKNVHFKDLGLLIIDEEQKFGVSVKERLKQLKANVDTLTMSATPIPRTLQFSLMGARDMSTLQTPPPNRFPIYTEVHTFSQELIADAIKFELNRNGQVFVVSGRISALGELEALIHRHVPEARVAVGHGQMNPSILEDIIVGFINHDFDVLLSTTIVENGIDIPNANTIIIDSAQKFGLSDLHQMRGRVGRGHQKAYCYLLAPPLSSLPSDARKRLEAIENFSGLGSGLHIAMQDLDIRGAGNLLGAEQSGFIADLGYETYQKILSEAVVELRNENTSDSSEGKDALLGRTSGGLFVADCSLETDIPMCFPESYIPTNEERVLLYRELDGLETERELKDFQSRLIDRFGPIPKESKELLEVVRLRSLGKSIGVENIKLKQSVMILYFVSNKESVFYQSRTFECSINYASKNFKSCLLEEKNGKRRMRISRVQNVKDAVTILQDITTS